MTRKIYAACLAACNSGQLHGAWIDLAACSSAADAMTAIQAMLAASPVAGAEEWAIHDSEDIPHSLGWYPSATELQTLVEASRQCADDLDWEAYCIWCDAESKIGRFEDFQDAYEGAHSGTAEYCMHRAYEHGIEPEEQPWPLNCIDWQQAWLELEAKCYWAKRSKRHPACVHIFSR